MTEASKQSSRNSDGTGKDFIADMLVRDSVKIGNLTEALASLIAAVTKLAPPALATAILTEAKAKPTVVPSELTAISLLREYRELDRAFDASLSSEEPQDNGPLIAKEKDLMARIDAYLSAERPESPHG